MKLKGYLANETRANHVYWSDSYAMGIKVIDDQHKELLAIVNSMFAGAAENESEGRVYFREVIQHAVQYIRDHFSMEEKYMIATRFPGYWEHKKKHDDFVLSVIQLAQEFDAGKRLMLEKLAYFLKDWVLSHVAIMDVQYAAYYRKIATRKADGRLSIALEDIAMLRICYRDLYNDLTATTSSSEPCQFAISMDPAFMGRETFNLEMSLRS